MNIQEGNKLIAIWMDRPYEFPRLKFSTGEMYKVEIAPNYDSDWNELMPVVEKIEQDNYGVKQCRKVVEIYYDDTKEVILRTKEKSRIESLYKAVVGFIQWYNTQQH